MAFDHHVPAVVGKYVTGMVGDNRRICVLAHVDKLVAMRADLGGFLIAILLLAFAPDVEPTWLPVRPIHRRSAGYDTSDE
jgi:hypothetical protein